MRGLKSVTLFGIAAILWAAPSLRAYGQTKTGTPPPSGELPPITLNVQDSPVRAALTQLFEAAHVQYSIDERVTGFETLHIIDQPFETALRVLVRSSSQPLTWQMEGGVYYVSVRKVTPSIPVESPLATTATASAKPANFSGIDVMTLTNADPYDLAALLGITIVRTGTRFDSLLGGAGAPSAGARGNSAGAPAGSSGTTSPALGDGRLISSDANNDIIHL